MKYGHFSVPVKPAFSGILFKNKSWEGVRWSNKKKTSFESKSFTQSYEAIWKVSS